MEERAGQFRCITGMTVHIAVCKEQRQTDIGTSYSGEQVVVKAPPTVENNLQGQTTADYE